MKIWNDVNGKPCRQGHKTKYCSQYDSLFCPKCNIWTEPPCKYDYPDCHFDCKNRPENPSTITMFETAKTLEESFDALNKQPATKRLMKNLKDL